MCSAGGICVEGRLFFGVYGDERFFRKRRMMDVRIQRVSILFSVCWLSVIVRNLLAHVLTHRPESYRSLD